MNFPHYINNIMIRLTLTDFYERSAAYFFKKGAVLLYSNLAKSKSTTARLLHEYYSIGYIKHIGSHTYFHGSSLVSNLAVCKKKFKK